MQIKEIIKEMFSNLKSNWYLPVVEKQVYSEAETVVGVWTDGKPLYRRVVEQDYSPKNNADDTIYTIENIDSVASLYGIYNASTGSSWIPLNTPRRVTSAGNIVGLSCSVSNDGNIIISNGGNQGWIGNSARIRITIEYTKTTDNPIEQSKVPFEPLVEYSTEEKMIGYFGEKSIYEITIAYSGNDGTVGTYDAVADISSLNVAYVLSAIAFNENASDNGCRVFDAIVQNNILKAKSSTSCIKSGDNVVVRYAKQ